MNRKNSYQDNKNNDLTFFDQPIKVRPETENGGVSFMTIKFARLNKIRFQTVEHDFF